MTARTIRLRRPPTLSVHDGVFVPALRMSAEGTPDALDDIDIRWQSLCRANPAYFDGRVYHVLGVHRNGHGGCVLHVMDCAYRFWAVQNSWRDLGVRPLGVKAFTWRDGRVLMGKRSAMVAAYPRLWEFAPGGSVAPPRDPARVIVDELLEEASLLARADPIALAVLFDPAIRSWEIVFHLDAASALVTPRAAEYDAMEWRTPADLPPSSIMSPVARQMTSLLRSLQRYAPSNSAHA